jgi:hypothetical protein
MSYLWRIRSELPKSLIGEYNRAGLPDMLVFIQGQRIAQLPRIPSFTFGSQPSLLDQAFTSGRAVGHAFVPPRLLGLNLPRNCCPDRL